MGREREREKCEMGRERLIDRVKKGNCFFVIIYCGFCGRGEYYAVIGEISCGGFPDCVVKWLILKSLSEEA